MARIFLTCSTGTDFQQEDPSSTGADSSTEQIPSSSTGEFSLVKIF